MRFIDEHRGQFAVALLLRVLGIDESTYYGWVKQTEQPCDRQLVDRGLLSNIYEIWTGSGRTYGSDRVWRQLRRDGIHVGRKRVERLMRAQGWQGAFLPASRLAARVDAAGPEGYAGAGPGAA
jgi:putative transposase